MHIHTKEGIHHDEEGRNRPFHIAAFHKLIRPGTGPALWAAGKARHHAAPIRHPHARAHAGGVASECAIFRFGAGKRLQAAAGCHSGRLHRGCRAIASHFADLLVYTQTEGSAAIGSSASVAPAGASSGASPPANDLICNTVSSGLPMQGGGFAFSGQRGGLFAGGGSG